PKLAHYDSGGGAPGEPPIMLLHQSLARSEDWENIFPRLATRYRTIAYDARGHGRSGRAPDYSLRAFADDALRMLREIVKEPAVLVGHSLGGLAALVAAADAPELVRGFVLEDPALGYAKAWDPAQYAALREGIASTAPALRAPVARSTTPPTRASRSFPTSPSSAPRDQVTCSTASGPSSSSRPSSRSSASSGSPDHRRRAYP